MRFYRILAYVLCLLAVQLLDSVGREFGLPSARAAGQSCVRVFDGGLRATHEGLGLAVYDRNLSVLEQFFVEMKNDSMGVVIDKLLAADLRASLFRLQSISKVYSERDAEFFGPLRENFKAFEDVLGRVSLMRELKKHADELGEPILAEAFKRDSAKAEAVLIERIEQSGWRKNPETTASELRKSLASYRAWPSRAEDKLFLVEEMAHSARKIQKASGKLEFDHKDIEKGLHELRRRLRWIAIQIGSIDGLVVAETYRVQNSHLRTWLRQLESADPSFYDNKYVKLSPVEVVDPIRVPREHRAILSNIIIKVGVLKDFAETYIFFEEAMEKAGFSGGDRSRVMAKLQAKLGQTEVDHRKIAVEYQNRINETELLSEFADAVREMNRP